jgi:hypothetical protein
MTRAASFAAGVLAGWMARSTVDSSREAFVRLVSLGYGAAARVRRIVALEREWLDDLFAEAKARSTPAPKAPPTNGDARPQPAPS